MKRGFIAVALFTLICLLPVIAFADEVAEVQNDAISEKTSSQNAVVASTKTPTTLTTEPKTVAQTPATMVEDGVYTIFSSLRSDAALDVSGASTSNGAKVQIYSDNTTPAQRWRIERLSNGFYRIINAVSEKVLDVAGGRVFSGNKVQQYAWNGTKAQQWKITTVKGGVVITSALSDKLVLDVRSGNKADGAQVQVYNSNGTKAQIWRLNQISQVLNDGYYVFTNLGSGLVVDISSGSIEDWGNAQQYSANGTLAQIYQLVFNKKNGYYAFRNAGSGKVLDVARGSTSNGGNVQQYNSNGTWAQYWDITKDKKNVLTIKSAKSGKSLDVSNGSMKNGANLQIYTPNATPAQQWSAKRLSNWLPEGTYFIVNRNASSSVLDVEPGGQGSGTNIQLYKQNDTNAQRFYLRPKSNGYYTIQNTFSGLYIDAIKTSSGANVVQSTNAEQWKPVLSDNGIIFQLKSNPKIVLSVANSSKNNGANVQVFSNGNAISQKWILRVTQLLSNGTYEITSSVDPNFALDGSNTTGSAQMQVKRSNGSAHQLFKFHSLGNEKYRITTLSTGKALQVDYSSNTKGSGQITQNIASSAVIQQWTPKLNADGSLSFVASVNSGKSVMNLSSGKATDGNTVGIYVSNNTAAQKWRISTGSKRSYDILSISLAQIVQWNWDGSSYTREYANTIAKLRDYMDPANGTAYQFADLRKPTATTAAQLDAFINTNGASGRLAGLGAAFVSAAKTYGLNQDYLLAHAILESGWGKSELASGYKYAGGYIDGTYYKAGMYYNFYGIGAYDDSPLSGGRKLAIINGWDTPEKAVTGAAKWIANNYVYANAYPQYTLYAMKWDYLRSNGTLDRGWHQYATGVEWARSIGSIMDQIYASTGTGGSVSYITPQYK